MRTFVIFFRVVRWRCWCYTLFLSVILLLLTVTMLPLIQLQTSNHLCFRVLVTKTFRTQGWADKIMAELGKVTFQRQRTKASVRPQMLGGVTFPGLSVVEPLEAQKAE